MTPAMSEDDRYMLETLLKEEQIYLRGLGDVRRARREILRRNRIRHAERVAPRVLQMRREVSQ